MTEKPEPIFIRPERAVDRVFIHCSAASRPIHANIAVLRHWHLERGFDDIGYHYFINYEGNVQKGRDVNIQPEAQGGNNTGTIAICCAGLHITDFTLYQLDALTQLCYDINFEYNDITFHGHNEVSNKDCPVFDYVSLLELDGAGRLGAIKQKARTLDIFDIGQDVIILQRQLNQFLHDNQLGGNIIVDGYFGNLTAMAVVRFQQLNDLTVDGIAGPNTRLKLPKIHRPGETE